MGKHHKEKKAQREHDDDNDNNNEEEIVVKDKKKSKEERNTKKRNRKERSSSSPDHPPQSTNEETADTNDVNERKRQKKENKKKKKQRDLMVKQEEEEESKKDKKKKKKRKKELEHAGNDNDATPAPTAPSPSSTRNNNIVASSALDFYDPAVKETKLAAAQTHTGTGTGTTTKPNTISLLLFYQYVQPPWDESTYDKMLKELQKLGTRLGLTGRMRVAKEGLNCTLTASHDNILEYCTTLQTLRPTDFRQTEFKVTQDLPSPQTFRELKVLAVAELVNYGLEGTKAPPLEQYHGTHLEPKDYHLKLAQDNTVIIDVRNHYEANIGRFVPPTTTANAVNAAGTDAATNSEPPKWLDPKMRKSTEFPAWLDRPETKEQMKGKQVLMYCTGTLRYVVVILLLLLYYVDQESVVSVSQSVILNVS